MIVKLDRTIREPREIDCCKCNSILIYDSSDLHEINVGMSNFKLIVCTVCKGTTITSE